MPDVLSTSFHRSCDSFSFVCNDFWKEWEGENTQPWTTKRRWPSLTILTTVKKLPQQGSTLTSSCQTWEHLEGEFRFSKPPSKLTSQHLLIFVGTKSSSTCSPALPPCSPPPRHSTLYSRRPCRPPDASFQTAMTPRAQTTPMPSLTWRLPTSPFPMMPRDVSGRT